MGKHSRKNKRKAINKIIDLYEKKLPIDISIINNKQILLTCACRYNDIETIDDIISSSGIPLYFNKPLKVAFKYGNLKLCKMALECGARIEKSPLLYRKNWEFLKDMIDDGLQERYITLRYYYRPLKFDLYEFKVYYIYDTLYNIYIPDLVKIIVDYLY
jgi:hypothetical protein